MNSYHLKLLQFVLLKTRTFQPLTSWLGQHRALSQLCISSYIDYLSFLSTLFQWKIRPLSLIIMSYFSWPVFYYLMKFLKNRLRLTLYFSPSYCLTHSSPELHWTPQNHDVPIFLLFETQIIATTTHYWMNLMAYRAFAKTEAVLSINRSYSSLILLVAFLLQRLKARHWAESERP